MSNAASASFRSGGASWAFSGWSALLRHSCFTLLIALLLSGGTALVYVTGGTAYAYPHIMLIPVMLGAVCYQLYGGLLVAAVAGVLLGPFMPLEVQEGLSQETPSWLLRLSLYVTLGGVAGILFGRVAAGAKARKNTLRTDAGCGFLNQSALKHDLSSALSASARTRARIAVVMVKIADITEILSGVGADAADALVGAIGKNIQRAVSDVSRIYRFGPSELLILLEYSRAEELNQVIADVAAAGEESVVVNEVPVRAQLVLGISRVRGGRSTAEELLRRTQVAAFEAMEQQQSYCHYSADYERNTAEIIRLVAQVRRALAAGEFELQYQPKIRLRDGAVWGCEGLIRWHENKHTLIQPGLFMPKVERTTLIAPVTRFVTGQASEFLSSQDIGPVSINFAVSNLFDEQLLQWLHQLVRDQVVPAHALEIEITEGALIRDPEAAKQIIQSLRDVGISVLLDDFGTGYSSFAHLRHLPISGLKIDRAFTKDLESDRRAYKLMACMIDVAHALDLTVTAEGVETAAQAELLRELNCDLAQGFYYARPMPESDYWEWLQQYQTTRKLRAEG